MMATSIGVWLINFLLNRWDFEINLAKKKISHTNLIIGRPKCAMMMFLKYIKLYKTLIYRIFIPNTYMDCK